jgi:hypothetical protein
LNCFQSITLPSTSSFRYLEARECFRLVILG